MTKRRVLRTFNSFFIYVLVIITLAWTLGPIVVMVLSSIVPERDLISVPPRIDPTHFFFKNYWDIFTSTLKTGTVNYQFKVSLINSFITASGVTIVCLIAGSLAAYAFARLDMPLKNSFVFVLLFTQMIPAIAIIIPLYVIATKLNMLDRRVTLVIIYASFTLPFVTWVMKGYFQTIPQDLEEAAMIDGCGRVGALFRIIIPLSAPGLFTTGIFAFLAAWNEFLMALIFTNSLASKTMPVAISEFIGRFRIDYGLMCTVGTIASFPPVALALIFQKYIVEGLTGGAVKG
ncbi:MAG: carbohydrate ABC transporter permease [bacterium]